MKKLLLGLLALPFVLTSCSKDDDASIVGKWQAYDVTVSATGVSTEILNTLSQAVKADLISECEKKSTMEFLADKTCKYTDFCNNNSVETSTWSQSGSTLSVNGQTLKIAAITSSELVFDMSEEISDELRYYLPSSTSLPSGAKFTVHYKFKRVN